MNPSDILGIFLLEDDTEPGAGPDVPGEQRFIRRLACGVIERAVNDIGTMGTNEVDVESALWFLFGAGDTCAGWAAVVGQDVNGLRSGVIRLFERRAADSYHGVTSQTGAQRRRAAKTALQRIRKYIHDGAWRSTLASHSAVKPRLPSGDRGARVVAFLDAHPEGTLVALYRNSAGRALMTTRVDIVDPAQLVGVYGRGVTAQQVNEDAEARIAGV